MNMKLSASEDRIDICGHCGSVLAQQETYSRGTPEAVRHTRYTCPKGHEFLRHWKIAFKEDQANG